ncbi:MAG: DUF2089 family protein [Candidatus Latescibacteria bacterium]|nr:DUF2089 family protein [Candidatus Latescibacterota bacterium]
MRKILERCPSCERALNVTQLSCTSCETVVSGRYSTCRFCALSPESLRLIEIFIKNRGNVKEMERELGLSYPTVRGRLDAAIAEMGFAVDDKEREEDASGSARQAVLDRLDKGEIDASEAADQLAKLSSE